MQAAIGARVLTRAFDRLDALQRAAAGSGRMLPGQGARPLGPLADLGPGSGGDGSSVSRSRSGGSSGSSGCGSSGYLPGGQLVLPQPPQVQLSFEPCDTLARGSGSGGEEEALSPISSSRVRDLGEGDVRVAGRAFGLGEVEVEALVEAAARVRRQCAGRSSRRGSGNSRSRESRGARDEG
jgi:hypothetical protein